MFGALEQRAESLLICAILAAYHLQNRQGLTSNVKKRPNAGLPSRAEPKQMLPKMLNAERST
jgi:hypothetical protein